MGRGISPTGFGPTCHRGEVECLGLGSVRWLRVGLGQLGKRVERGGHLGHRVGHGEGAEREAATLPDEAVEACEIVLGPDHPAHDVNAGHGVDAELRVTLDGVAEEDDVARAAGGSVALVRQA